MSYDFAVWVGSATTTEQAIEEFESLSVEYLDADDPPEPDPRIMAFVETLTDRWPDDELDDGPWAAAPLIDEAAGPIIYFATISEDAYGFGDFVAESAAAAGLICFDPQTETLRTLHATPRRNRRALRPKRVRSTVVRCLESVDPSIEWIDAGPRWNDTRPCRYWAEPQGPLQFRAGYYTNDGTYGDYMGMQIMVAPQSRVHRMLFRRMLDDAGTDDRFGDPSTDLSARFGAGVDRLEVTEEDVAAVVADRLVGPFANYLDACSRVSTWTDYLDLVEDFILTPSPLLYGLAGRVEEGRELLDTVGLSGPFDLEPAYFRTLEYAATLDLDVIAPPEPGEHPL